DRATYGENEIRKAIELGAVDLLLASEDLNMTRIELTCQNTNEKRYKTIPTERVDKFESNLGQERFDFCDSIVTITKNQDLIEEIGELALETGAKVEIISPETEEGQQLLHFGGLAAILRYNINF
ncbi:MAG: peptide chain release factor aRF-1, partial [Candidatus Hodarchaeales archaeon]